MQTAERSFGLHKADIYVSSTCGYFLNLSLIFITTRGHNVSQMFGKKLWSIRELHAMFVQMLSCKHSTLLVLPIQSLGLQAIFIDKTG